MIIAIGYVQVNSPSSCFRYWSYILFNFHFRFRTVKFYRMLFNLWYPKKLLQEFTLRAAYFRAQQRCKNRRMKPYFRTG